MSLAWQHDAGASALDGPVAFKSPSLELLISRREAPGKHEVLDLGTPTGVNVEFFSRLSCKIYIEDLTRHLIDAPRPPPPADDEPPIDWGPMVEDALLGTPRGSYDMIFGWDLFNYMPPGMIKALMERVANHCTPGTLLFIISSTLGTIPDRPGRISISRDSLVSYEPTAAAATPNPKFTPLALERMMPGFGLLHSFLLGDGMQDYLFSFQ